jgi:hypothetical protein
MKTATVVAAEVEEIIAYVKMTALAMAEAATLAAEAATLAVA